MILSATFAGLLWTDHGFRRAEDCTAILRLRDWHAGHYHSVRHSHACDDPLYLGKGADLWTDEPAYSLWTPSLPGSEPSFETFAQADGSLASRANMPTPPPFWRDSPERGLPSPPPAPSLPPIPLPASAWLLLTALGLLMWRTR